VIGGVKGALTFRILPEVYIIGQPLLYKFTRDELPYFSDLFVWLPPHRACFEIGPGWHSLFAYPRDLKEEVEIVTKMKAVSVSAFIVAQF